MRFEYFVQYDHYSPEDRDGPLTQKSVVAALSKFQDALRGVVIAADPDATIETAPVPRGQPTEKRVFLSTNIDAGTVDETVQRCARNHHLKATLRGCA